MLSSLVVDGYNGGTTAECHEFKEVGAIGAVANEEDYQNNLTANRWPHQETLALLKIRSEMDNAFRESNLKSPLWEVVSRKLAELGYHRSAKKCKEKFENIYKYHKRIKGREEKDDARTYRFSNELEALRHHHSLQVPVVASTENQADDLQTIIPSSSSPKIIIHDFIFTSSTSSSSSDEESDGIVTKKRRLADFFDNLMKVVVEKQDILQKKFLDTLEKRENERIAKEDAWRLEEIARIKRKHDMLMQELLVSATRDATIIELLKNFPDQSNLKQLKENPLLIGKTVDILKWGDDDDAIPMSSSRWPRVEVEALIELRTKLDRRYQEDVAKGPLWEEISSAMKKLGYYRSAKKCKEKWENINKYFKKVKGSNKIRPEGSKTCPYFHRLDALYKERMDKISSSLHPSYGLKAEDLVVHHMNRPEREEMLLQHKQDELDKINSDNQNKEYEYGADNIEDGGNDQEMDHPEQQEMLLQHEQHELDKINSDNQNREDEYGADKIKDGGNDREMNRPEEQEMLLQYEQHDHDEINSDNQNKEDEYRADKIGGNDREMNHLEQQEMLLQHDQHELDKINSVNLNKEDEFGVDKIEDGGNDREMNRELDKINSDDQNKEDGYEVDKIVDGGNDYEMNRCQQQETLLQHEQYELDKISCDQNKEDGHGANKIVDGENDCEMNRPEQQEMLLQHEQHELDKIHSDDQNKEDGYGVDKIVDEGNDREMNRSEQQEMLLQHEQQELDKINSDDQNKEGGYGADKVRDVGDDREMNCPEQQETLLQHEPHEVDKINSDDQNKEDGYGADKIIDGGNGHKIVVYNSSPTTIVK